MTNLESLRAKHAQYVELYRQAAADEGGIQHWLDTHRATGESQRLLELAAEIKQLYDAYRVERANTQQPPTLDSLRKDALAMCSLDTWTADELANAGRNLGQAIYAKGVVDALVFIAGLTI